MIIRVLTDEDAVVSMVDSNMHRDKILPSEKAFAYKMKYEAMKQKVGRRKGSRNGHVNKGKKTVQIMGEEAGEIQKVAMVDAPKGTRKQHHRKVIMKH